MSRHRYFETRRDGSIHKVFSPTAASGNPTTMASSLIPALRCRTWGPMPECRTWDPMALGPGPAAPDQALPGLWLCAQDLPCCCKPRGLGHLGPATKALTNSSQGRRSKARARQVIAAQTRHQRFHCFTQLVILRIWWIEGLWIPSWRRRCNDTSD